MHIERERIKVRIVIKIAIVNVQKIIAREISTNLATKREQDTTPLIDKRDHKEKEHTLTIAIDRKVATNETTLQVTRHSIKLERHFTKIILTENKTKEFITQH